MCAILVKKHGNKASKIKVNLIFTPLPYSFKKSIILVDFDGLCLSVWIGNTLQKAIDLVTKATEEDKKKNYEEALR